MKVAIIFLALIPGAFSASAAGPETVTKENLIEAFREYRTGVELISAIHLNLMQSSFNADPRHETKIPKEQIEGYLRARKHLEKSAALNPYFPETYVFLANSYWEIELDLGKTVEYYGKALEVYPDYDDVISARGQVFVLLNRIEDARKDLKRLEALGSDYARSLREQIAELETKGTQNSTEPAAIPPEPNSEGGEKTPPEPGGRPR